MAHFLCVQCGTQFEETDAPPPFCPVCEDVRQYVRWSGQEWTTFEDLRKTALDAKPKVDISYIDVAIEL